MSAKFTHLYCAAGDSAFVVFSFMAPAQITHCIALSRHSPKQLWPIPAQLIHIELGPASQYFSTTLSAPPNLNLLEHSLEASVLFPTLITTAGILQVGFH